MADRVGVLEHNAYVLHLVQGTSEPSSQHDGILNDVMANAAS